MSSKLWLRSIYPVPLLRPTAIGYHVASGGAKLRCGAIVGGAGRWEGRRAATACAALSVTRISTDRVWATWPRTWPRHRGSRHRAPTVIGVDSLRDARTGGHADLSLRPLRRVGARSEHGLMRSLHELRFDRRRTRGSWPRTLCTEPSRCGDGPPAPARCRSSTVAVSRRAPFGFDVRLARSRR